MDRSKILLLFGWSVAVAASAQPGSEAPVAPQPPGPIGTPAGSGPFPAIAEARADAPGYTVYRPAAMPPGRLPLVLWGNGGCRDNGLSASHFLREIASHGYVVVANGAPRAERPALAAPAVAPPPPASPQPLPGQAGGPAPVADETSTAQLLGAIDWAARADRGGALRGHVDLARVAVMGHSCGGLQALAAAADRRIRAVVIFDSGVYNRPGNGLSGVRIGKADLAKLHTPVAYILGGPADIAFANGSDDVARIDHVPVMLASLPVGHGGTLSVTNGGEWGQVGAAWLDWQLKRDPAAARWFVGKACRLCADPRWTLVRKQFGAA